MILLFYIIFPLRNNSVITKNTLTEGINNNAKSGDYEEDIQNRNSYEPIKSKFIPVLIYKKRLNMEFSFTCNGTIVRDGKDLVVITAEHLFSKKDPAFLYMCRDLFSTRNWNIESVINTGHEITGKPADIVTLKVGSSKEIKGYSIHLGKQFWIRTRFFKDESLLTSLVTGQKIKVLGIATGLKKDSGVDYYIIDYASQEGESGTGFVDINDNLYILKGSFKKTRNKEYTIVYGPIEF